MFLLPKAIFFFMPFIVAWIIAVIANPTVTWLEKRISLRRKHGSAIIVIGVLLAIITIIYFLISGLMIFGARVLYYMPTILSEVSASVSQLLVKLQILSDNLPKIYREYAIQIISVLSDLINTTLSEAAIPTFNFAGDIVKSVPSMLVYFVITLVSAYLFIAKRESIYTYFSDRTPAILRKYWNRFSHDLKFTIAGYFIAQLKISMIVMVTMAVGFMLLGVKYGFWIAFGIGILDYMPVLGAGAVLIPWGLIDLINGNMYSGIGMLVIYIMTQTLRQMLQPKLVGDSIGMPPLHTLLCLFLGFRLAGFGGMIVAIPIGMLFLKLYEYGIFDSLFASLKTIADIASDFRKKGL